MSLIHKNQDSVFSKNRMSYFEKYTKVPHTKNQAFLENRKLTLMPFRLYDSNPVWFPKTFYITIGWQTTWEWYIFPCNVFGEIGWIWNWPNDGVRILEIYTIRGRKNKSYVMGLGVFLGHRGIVFKQKLRIPGQNKLKCWKFVLYIKITMFPYFFVYLYSRYTAPRPDISE